ncbi:hypothetical protein GCM10027610_025740 [Dactylosporangium cerinum]
MFEQLLADTAHNHAIVAKQIMRMLSLIRTLQVQSDRVRVSAVGAASARFAAGRRPTAAAEAGCTALLIALHEAVVLLALPPRPRARARSTGPATALGPTSDSGKHSSCGGAVPSLLRIRSCQQSEHLKEIRCAPAGPQR